MVKSRKQQRRLVVATKPLHGQLKMLGFVAGALLAFVAFLALVVLVESHWPNAEHSRYFQWWFGPAFFSLLLIEVVLYVRLQTLQAKLAFFVIYAGRSFVICTKRKGWYPLLASLAAAGFPAQFDFVWWRERDLSPIGWLALSGPPVDLPFVLIVTSSDVKCISVGMSLRQHRRGSPSHHLAAAQAALNALTQTADKAQTA